MEVKLAYSEAELQVKIPPEADVDIFTPRIEDTNRPAIPDEADDGDDLHAFLSCEPLLLVVNDGHRNTPTSKILGFLDRIDHSLLDRAEFLIATGAHDAPAREHLTRIFGPYYDRVHPRLTHHDSRDYAAMTSIGVDSIGGEVFINSRVLEAAGIFVIGSVEPHYFAGFTGGRKSFFPGLCDFATIERNHNLANSLDAAPLRLDGNPVAEHMVELMTMLDSDKIFAAQAVCNSQGQMVDLCVGPHESAFCEATRSARKLFVHPIDDPYDVVISEMLPPLDRNLYQAQKALENTQMAVVDGGAVIVVSACKEGIGSRYFFDLAAGWDRKNNIPSDGVVAFGSHKLSRVNAISTRIDIRLYSELPDTSARRVFYEPLDNISKFLEERMKGKQQLRVAIVRDAGHTVLIN